MMTDNTRKQGLQWADEEIQPGYDGADKIMVSGEHFWRSVWKRIEGSHAQPSRPLNQAQRPLEPPRDYVVEGDNWQSVR